MGQNWAHTPQPVHSASSMATLPSLTNIAGFGTLMLGSYPALRSFGLVATLGSLTCLLTSLTLVPALMGTAEPRKPAS